MANLFKQGRVIGKGVRYLTQLGSKIGKSIGSSVDKLGAGTRSTQAATIKSARGVRDAAQSAGRGIAEGARTARAGYNSGRSGSLHLSDVAETPAQKYHHGKMAAAGRANFIQPGAPNRDKYIKANRKLPSLNEWMNTHGKQYIKNPGTMPGHNSAYNKAVSNIRKSTSSPGSNGKNWAVPVNNPKNGGIMPTAEDKAAAQVRADKYKNYMTKGKPATSGGGVINKPPRPPKRPSSGSGDYMSNSPRGGKYSIGTRISDDQFVKNEIMKNTGRSGGMSKNRRAGIITLGAAGAGYGVHKGNEALQNHYQRQKNASR